MGNRGPLSGTRKYDTAEVVRVAVAAYRLDQSMAVAVSGHFGISLGAARGVISRARQDGASIPSQVGFNAGSTGFEQSNYSPCGTPGAYKRHIRLGQEPCQVCKDDKARRARLRRQGISTARPEPEWDGEVVTYSGPGIRLMCDTCGDFMDTVPKLVHHTLQVHQRPPSRTERTPR